MNKLAIVSGIKTVGSKALFTVKKNSPAILLVAGVVGTIATVVVACRETTKAQEIMNKHDEEMANIEAASSGEFDTKDETYTEEDRKKDTVKVYAHTIGRMIKNYAPAAGLMVLSIGCLCGSYGILRKRNIALTAAYGAIDSAFKKYRKRVVDEYGTEVDKRLRSGAVIENIDLGEKDKKGKPVNTPAEVLDPDDPSHYSQYARFFPNDLEGFYFGSDNDTRRSPEYNKQVLMGHQEYCNQLLRTRGWLLLNDVYEILGYKKTSAGSIVGWVKGSKDGDGYVDFGIMNGYSKAKRDFVNGYESTILIDFNVDGPIWDKIDDIEAAKVGY